MFSLVVFSSNSVTERMLDLKRMDRKKLQYSDSRGRVK